MNEIISLPEEEVDQILRRALVAEITGPATLTSGSILPGWPEAIGAQVIAGRVCFCRPGSGKSLN